MINDNSSGLFNVIIIYGEVFNWFINNMCVYVLNECNLLVVYWVFYKDGLLLYIEDVVDGCKRVVFFFFLMIVKIIKIRY